MRRIKLFYNVRGKSKFGLAEGLGWREETIVSQLYSRDCIAVSHVEYRQEQSYNHPKALLKGGKGPPSTWRTGNQGLGMKTDWIED